MISNISRLVRNSCKSVYKNFNADDVQTVLYDIEYHNVAYLHFIHKDKSQSIMNLFTGEIDLLDSQGKVLKTYEYENIRAGLEDIMCR